MSENSASVRAPLPSNPASDVATQSEDYTIVDADTFLSASDAALESADLPATSGNTSSEASPLLVLDLAAPAAPLLRFEQDESSSSVPSSHDDSSSSFHYNRVRRSASSRRRQRSWAGGGAPSTAVSTTSSSSSRTLSTDNSRPMASSLRASLDAGMAAMRRWIRSHASSTSGNSTITVDPERGGTEADFFDDLRPPTIFEHEEDVGMATTMAANRQRTRSEPDSLHVQDFFYASMRRRRRAYTAEGDDNLPPSSGRPSSTPNRERHMLSSSAAAALSWTNSANSHPLVDHPSTMTTVDHASTLSFMDNLNTNIVGQHNLLAPHSIAATITAEQQHEQQVTPPAQAALPQQLHSATQPLPVDPEREARIRWMRINRRFQLVITGVALLFSVLLFAILVCWVFLTSTYVVTLDKPCDVNLREYFWLVSLQLVLDIFRSDILRFVLRWDSSSTSQERLPCRVIVYNIAYLFYALLVLRLGITSVYVGNPTCKSTAPELFKASAAFVSLSIAAWFVIIFGYVVPLFVVAGLLTFNGYNPTAGDGNNDNNHHGAAVFPVSNGAPPGCIEQLPHVPVEDVLGQECCICMEEFGSKESDRNEMVVRTLCNHAFHEPCCREWLRQARTCPVCRSDIPSTLEGLDEEGAGTSVGEQPFSRIPVGPTGRPVRGLLRIFRQRGDRRGSGSPPPSPTFSRSVTGQDIEAGRSPTTPGVRYSSN